jgi:hypothetical protein
MNTVAKATTTPDWCTALRELAHRADVLQQAESISLDDRLQIASDAFSLLWLAWSPQTIARSCRASARLLEPVIVVSGDLDQQLMANSTIRQQALKAAEALDRPAPAQLAPVLPADDLDDESSPPPAPAQQLTPTPPAPALRRCMADFQPPGWLRADQLGAAAGCSGAQVRLLMRRGAIPDELIHKAGPRSIWFAPEVAALVAGLTKTKKSPPVMNRRADLTLNSQHSDLNML